MYSFVMIFFISVGFCKRYSYTHNGPCQNGGELINSIHLAREAQCSCKPGYWGYFCDIVSKVYIMWTQLTANNISLLLPYYSWTERHWFMHIISKLLSQYIVFYGETVGANAAGTTQVYRIIVSYVIFWLLTVINYHQSI